MSELTLQEVIDFHTERLDRLGDEFEGQMPVNSVRTIVRYAAKFESILSRYSVYTENEEAPEPDFEELQEALEKQAADLLGAISALQYEYGLDIVSRFEEQRSVTEALENAESVEELEEALTDSDIDIQSIEGMPVPDVETGENVDMDDYDHDERGRDVY